MLLSNKKLVIFLSIALALRLALFLGMKPWNKEDYERKVINQDAIMYNEFALGVLENHKLERRKGVVSKWDFQNKGLVLRLLEKKVIKNHKYWPRGVCFNDSIKNEDQLREQLEQIGISKIEPILAIWRQSQKSNPLTGVPGYPLFIAVIYFLFGYRPYMVALIQILIGVITCLLLYKLGTAMFDERVGLLAGYLLAFEYVSIMFEQVLYSDTLFTFLFLVAIYLLVKFLKTEHKKYLAYVGIFLGLAALCRLVGLYFPVVLIVFFLFGYIRREIKFSRLLASGLIIVLSFWLTISPWLIRNYLVFGPPLEFTPYKGAVLSAHLTYLEQAKTGVDYSIAFRRVSEELRELTKDKHLSPSQLVKYEEWFAIKKILGNPLIFAKIQLTGILALYSGHGKNIFSYLLGLKEGGWLQGERHKLHSVSAFFKQEIWPSFQGIINSRNQWLKTFFFLLVTLFVMLYASVIIGIVFMWRNKKFSELLLLVAVIGYFTILSVPIANMRYRIPFMPYIMMLAAYGIIGLWNIKFIQK